MLYNKSLPKFRIFIFLLTVIVLPGFINAAPGDLDLAFGSGGVAVSPVNGKSYDVSNGSVLQADGKIIFVGSSTNDTEYSVLVKGSTVVTRLNSDGSLDNTFGRNGKFMKTFGLGSNASAVALQPDGKIIVGGGISFPYSNGFVSHFLVIRLNPNGTLDNTFGVNGAVTTTYGDNVRNVLTSIAVQPNGKIVAAGNVLSNSNPPATNVPPGFIVSYNADGSLDTTFDSDGKLSVNIDLNIVRFNAVAVQTDGKIVCGGYAVISAVNNFFLIRLNPNGSFDNSFDGDGRVLTPVGTSAQLTKLKIGADGKIVGAGQFLSSPNNRDFVIIRYNSDGSLDTSFDSDGIVTANLGYETLGGLDIQPDGKIVAGGNLAPDNNFTYYTLLAIRYNVNGSLDATFDSDGIATTSIPFAVNVCTATLIQPDGKVILSGYSNTIANSNIQLIRYNQGGALDTSFDADGILNFDLGNSNDILYKIAVQPDGKIVAAGYIYDALYEQPALARFNADGSRDTSFGNQGEVITPQFYGGTSQPYGGWVSDLVIQTDGKIVTAVTYHTIAESSFKIFRYNSDGSLDTAFGSGGGVSVQIGTLYDYCYGLVLQSDGKIVAAGNSGNPATSGEPVALIRLNTDGSLDSSFGVGGQVVTSDPNHYGYVSKIIAQPDGKFVIGGRAGNTTHNAEFFLSRYNANGTLDSSFGSGGAVYTVFDSQISSGLTDLAIQADNKIVATGFSNSGYTFARYNADGSLDNSFDGDGKLKIASDGYNSINALAIQTNGKIVATGTARNNQKYMAVVLRLNTNGSPDGTFGNNGIIFTSIGEDTSGYNDVIIQSSGKILAGGYSSNGANYDFTLARYQGDSTGNRTKFDFDGDGKSDVSVFRPSNGAWYLQQSQNGFTGVTFGISTDKIVPADYDGDGKSDVAVYRDGTWYIQRSSLGFTGISFGAADDVPVPADYDGDGKADVAVFRPSSGAWYLLRSQLGFTGIAFGQTGDKPVPADYDGDGKADVAVYRGGTWYLLQSQLGFTGVTFGTATDKPVPADFDGDGKADVAVYRDGTWYLLRSTLGFTGVTFGDANDKPVPADYDGDGKTDVAVFRPSNGAWYLLQSQSGFTGIAFGAGKDTPIPNAFVY